MLLLLALVMGAPPVRADSVAPRALEIYGENDPQRKMKVAIERMMGIYLVDPPRRHASEKVVIKGGRIRFDIWQPVGRNTDLELKTRAVKWLVFGRTGFSNGARGIFSEYPRVAEVMLVFHEVSRPDKKKRRRTRQTEKITRYLILKLGRQRFERLEIDVLERCVSRADCGTVFGKAFDGARFVSKYTAKRRKEAEL
jgi:hypothetical protein